MNKIDFNKEWICYRAGKKENACKVSIPHDAMLWDPKSEKSPGGVNLGWYETNDYIYEKNFYVPMEDKNKKLVLEFEGVYHKAAVYVNDQKAGYMEYGYFGFYVNLTHMIKYGENNTIRVEAVNKDQPNSRWYSGTGIYRPVWMYVLPKDHIELEGIKVTTLDYQQPQIRVDVDLETRICEDIIVEILDTDGKKVADHTIKKGNGIFSHVQCEISIPGANLWSPQFPYLYTCKVTYGEDVQKERFGLRVISCNSENGFCINGERVILRGACFHHDNGILGAKAYDFAEYRKVKILQDAGYNALRSAHNPCSKTMLKACDELGMLMMDEYVDVWYIHKTKYDYAGQVEMNYKKDLQRIVDKDYNHPSVILYSTGNEVAETAQKKGIELCKKLTECLHELDSTRPVTCGINIFFNFLSSMGFGVYSDKKAEEAVKDVKKKKAVGSEFFNTLAGFMGADFMKFGATLYPCDVKTRDAFASMDIAGYNYGIKRYKHDLEKYPKRLILGSETFCSDAYRFWEAAKKEKRIIGDFVWAGMDYLGEVGVGAWEYEEYAPRFDFGNGWVSAGSGRLDLTGKQLAEMKYTRVAFELDKIGIGVIPVPYTKKKHSPSAWKMTNAIESWSWNGCNGMEAKVEVYARGSEVSVFVNERCVGTKKIKNDCRVLFKIPYEPGILKAVSYDEEHQIIAEKELTTAGNETILTLEPEQRMVLAENGLCYVRMKYTDKNGILKPLERGTIELTVEGGDLLGAGSACPYYTKKYLDSVTDTYFGEALAIIQPCGTGIIKVHAKSKCGTAEVMIEAK